jgi:hypothetical protein
MKAIAAIGRAKDLRFKTFSVHTCCMAIPKEEHAKYLQDVQAFLTEVGASLTSIQLDKSAGLKFIYEGGGNSAAKKEVRGYDGGDDLLDEGEELGDYEKGFVWYTGGSIMVDISGPRDKETEGMDIGLINEIPDDIKVRLETEDEPYTLDDIRIGADVVEGRYDILIKGRKMELLGLSSQRMTAEQVEFFEKTFIPAAEKHGIIMDDNFVMRIEYYKKHRKEIEYDWAVDDLLGKINAWKASVEGSTHVLVHARAERFELALDGKDIVWFDVNEGVNDVEYDFITRRVDEVAKELGFTFHDGPEPAAEEGLTPQPQQPPSLMPPMPPSQHTVMLEAVDAKYGTPEHKVPLQSGPTEPSELPPSQQAEVQPEQLNAAQGSPAPEQTNHKVKKVMKKVKKKQTDLSGKEDEWPGDR